VNDAKKLTSKPSVIKADTFLMALIAIPRVVTALGKSQIFELYDSAPDN